jgi:hypothetical protein
MSSFLPSGVAPGAGTDVEYGSRRGGDEGKEPAMQVGRIDGLVAPDQIRRARLVPADGINHAMGSRRGALVFPDDAARNHSRSPKWRVVGQRRFLYAQ